MEEKEIIKQKVDIVELIGESITVHKSGAHFKALCPFHEEKTPSFMINPVMGIYKCFGCGKGGDCFSWLMEMESMTFGEALQTLAKKVGVVLTKNTLDPADKIRQEILEVLSQAQELYHWILTKHPDGDAASRYLAHRKISELAVKTYKLGWAPDDWDALLKTFLKKGYKLEHLIAANLVQSKSPNRNYDRFRGRLMFPLHDHRGQTIGFAGRILPPEFSSKSTQNKETAKYVNTSETPVFHKRFLLYGLDINKSEIKKNNQVIVVEGELDAIASWQAGIKEVVAIKGSILTEEQISILNKYTQNLILALDMDFAGDQAARRGLQAAEQAGMEVKLVRLNAGKDPADLATSNPSDWIHAVKQAVDVYKFSLLSAISRHGTANGNAKLKIVKELTPLWLSITSPVLKTYWVSELAKKVDISESAIWQEMDKKSKTASVRTLEKNYNDPEILNEASVLVKPYDIRQENLIAGGMILYDLEQMISPETKKLFQQPWIHVLIKSLSDGIKIEPSGQLDLKKLNLPSEIQIQAAEAMLMAEEWLKDKNKLLKCIHDWKISLIKSQKKALRHLLNEAENLEKDEEIAMLQKQIDTLNLLIAQLQHKQV